MHAEFFRQPVICVIMASANAGTRLDTIQIERNRIDLSAGSTYTGRYKFHPSLLLNTATLVLFGMVNIHNVRVSLYIADVG